MRRRWIAIGVLVVLGACAAPGLNVPSTVTPWGSIGSQMMPNPCANKSMAAVDVEMEIVRDMIERRVSECRQGNPMAHCVSAARDCLAKFRPEVAATVQSYCKWRTAYDDRTLLKAERARYAEAIGSECFFP